MANKNICKRRRSERRVAVRSERRAYRQMLLRARDAVIERRANHNIPIPRRLVGIN